MNLLERYYRNKFAAYGPGQGSGDVYDDWPKLDINLFHWHQSREVLSCQQERIIKRHELNFGTGPYYRVTDSSNLSKYRIFIVGQNKNVEFYSIDGSIINFKPCPYMGADHIKGVYLI